MTKVTFLLISALLLTACAGASNTPTTSNNSAGNSAAAITPSDGSVALTYNTSDLSLYLADSRGLMRWRDGGWTAISVPANDGLSAVAINPGAPAKIYVAGLGIGVMRTSDGGANWTALNTGLPKLDVTALAIHSFNRDTLYAWLKDDGVYKTEDGGASWKRVPDQGPPDKDVRGLMHSTLPGSMNTGWLYADTPTGAYLSMDCF